jgi:ABC-2 type transport system permease protein
MQVFKTYIKILGRIKGQLILYLAIFFVMAMAFTTFFSGSEPDINFSPTKTSIAIVNKDKGSTLTRGLTAYLEENTRVVEIAENKKAQQDALFFREIEYLINVPDGFGDKLVTEKPLLLGKTTVPGSVSGVYLDMLINKYLNTVHIYHKRLPGLSEKEIADYVKKDMQKATQVTIKHAREIDSENRQAAKSYFNFFNYAIWMIMIFGVSTTMTAFSKMDVRRRNLASPLASTNFNLQLVSGNLFLMLAIWLILIIPSFLLFHEVMVGKVGLMLILNSLIFSLSSLAFSYLIALLIKGPNAMSAVANVVALGSSFISGAFVPQSMLADSVLFASSFTPSYWFIQNNERILSLDRFSAEQLSPVISHMAVVLGFAVAALIAALVTAKYKRA